MINKKGIAVCKTCRASNTHGRGNKFKVQIAHRPKVELVSYCSVSALEREVDGLINVTASTIMTMLFLP